MAGGENEEPLNNGQKEPLDADIDVSSDEYVRRRRLKSLNDSRETANKVGPKAWSDFLTGNIAPGQRDAFIFSGVRYFLRDHRKQLEAVAGAEEILTTQQLQPWRPAPPSGKVADPKKTLGREPDSYELVDVRTTAPVSVDGQTGQIQPIGLNFMFRASPIFDVVWDCGFNSALSSDDHATVRTPTAVPGHVSYSAMDLAIDVLDNTELNLENGSEGVDHAF